MKVTPSGETVYDPTKELKQAEAVCPEREVEAAELQITASSWLASAMVRGESS